MTRIVKEFEERRQEFLLATKEFFFSVGYERMSISMLTQKIGVAKGTFYHYFKSKEDLLSQWVIHEMSIVIAGHKSIANNPKLSAIDKLNRIFQHGRDWKLQHLDMIVSLIKIMYDDHNIRLRVEMSKQSSQLSRSIFEKIIRQGMEEGVFSTSYPTEISIKVGQISELFSEDFANILLKHYENNDGSLKQAQEAVRVWQDVLERILGAPKGVLELIDDDYLQNLFDHIAEFHSDKSPA